MSVGLTSDSEEGNTNVGFGINIQFHKFLFTTAAKTKVCIACDLKVNEAKNNHNKGRGNNKSKYGETV